MSLKQQIKMQDSKIGASLLSRSLFRPQAGTGKRSAVAQLTLTSLVDCFTILIVYLLVATHIGGQEIHMPKGLELPVAQTTQSYETGVTVSYVRGNYVIDDKVISLRELTSKLEANPEDKKEFLNIVADKKAEFEDLNSAVLAGMQAGFKQIRFVVKQEDEA